MWGYRTIIRFLIDIAAGQVRYADAQGARDAAINRKLEKIMSDTTALTTSVANLGTSFKQLMDAETAALTAAHAADDSAAIATAVSNINAITGNMADALAALTTAAPVVTPATATTTLAP